MKKILYMLYKIKICVISNLYILLPARGTYGALYRYKNVFSADKYIKIRNKIFHKVERIIQNKEEKKIRIVMADCTEWATSQIYDYFSRQGLNIAVVLAPFFHGTDESIKKAYSLCREFCENKKIRYLDAYDPDSWKFKIQHVQDIYGDIMIYTNPWMGAYPQEFNIKNVPLTSVTCYIPYGFMLAKHEHEQFNQFSHNMFTHIYCETKVHWQMYAKYCDIGNAHVEYAGYPKMDWYVEQKEIDEKSIWKGLSDDGHKVKIIYSPHWGLSQSGTFMDNGLKILEYAEKHVASTSWIYKPHPLLEKEVIIQEYMNAKEYQAYVERWENLPNAKVYLSGDYSDIFMSSDCIINDSISFIAEYMYTHKPMLLLHNESAQYNDFGEQCKKHLYICDSKDIDGVERFIGAVLAGKDDMKAERENFFKEYLDYYHYHGEKASEYIIHQISNMMGI